MFFEKISHQFPYFKLGKQILKLRISREWRQKIESWLQANEQDEKQNEEYRRKMRRVTSSRRSLETDTGDKIFCCS